MTIVTRRPLLRRPAGAEDGYAYAPRRLRGVASTVAIAVPRFALAYPLYILSSVLIIDFRRTTYAAYLKLIGLVAASGFAVALASAEGTISPVGWVLEIALMLPLLLFVSGFEVIADWRSLIFTIRLINLVFLVLSLLNVLASGFPHRIPYLNEHPDVFSAAYGPGGARSVTILGFFGLVAEAMASKRGKQASRVAVLIALFNFLAPSYVIGICCGLLALGLTQARNFRRILALTVAAVPSIYYALFRLGTVNHTFQTMTGYNPKSVPFILPGHVFSAFPALSIFGLGAGQFSSTPQNWEDPGLRAVALHSVPHVPGLRATYFEQRFLFDPFTSVALQFHSALSSAISKPYNGFETLLIEWGLVSVVLLGIFFAEIVRAARHDRLIWAAAFFFIALNLTDLWTDSVWVGLGLLLTKGLAKAPLEDGR